MPPTTDRPPTSMRLGNVLFWQLSGLLIGGLIPTSLLFFAPEDAKPAWLWPAAGLGLVTAGVGSILGTIVGVLDRSRPFCRTRNEGNETKPLDDEELTTRAGRQAESSTRKDGPMKRDKSGADTVEMPALTASPRATAPATGSARVQVDLGALSHQGLVRSGNEDHYLVLRFGRTLETLLTSLPADQIPARSEEVGYGLLVADGVGGAAAGETASRVAIVTLIGQVLHTPDWIMSDEVQDVEQVMLRFAERFRGIHAALRDQGSADPNLAGMGTTMTLACSLGASVVIGHVGDSRVYLYRGGRLHQLTRDHTYVQALMDLGQLNAQEAARHPLRHVLTRSLGGSEHDAEGDFQRAQLADGDQLLLCTDGLTNMVDDATVGSVLGAAKSAAEACQALVAKALEKGGKDNVTVALARYHFPP